MNVFQDRQNRSTCPDGVWSVDGNGSPGRDAESGNGWE